MVRVRHPGCRPPRVCARRPRVAARDAPLARKTSIEEEETREQREAPAPERRQGRRQGLRCRARQAVKAASSRCRSARRGRRGRGGGRRRSVARGAGYAEKTDKENAKREIPRRPPPRRRFRRRRRRSEGPTRLSQCEGAAAGGEQTDVPRPTGEDRRRPPPRATFGGRRRHARVRRQRFGSGKRPNPSRCAHDPRDARRRGGAATGSHGARSSPDSQEPKNP